MNKKFRYFLFVLLLIVPMTLAACGGDDDDDNGDNGDAEDLELNQSFESDMGVTFDYPEGWAASEDAGQIFLGNSQSVMDKMQSTDMDSASPEEDEAGFVISALSLADMGMEASDTTLDEIFGMMTGAMTGEGMSTDGDAEDITIDGTDAKLQRVSDSESGSDGFIIAFLEDEGFVMMIGLTAEGEADDYEDVAQEIAATIEFTAPSGDDAMDSDMDDEGTE